MQAKALSARCSIHHMTARLTGCCTGELGRLQAEAAGAHSGMHSVKATLQAGPRRAVVESRGHLEANMASALALQSPSEWRRWLLSYAHHLAGEGLTSQTGDCPAWLHRSVLGP